MASGDMGTFVNPRPSARRRFVRPGVISADRGCSTPFGITEFRGYCTRDMTRILLVLNAFRHHGVSRGCLKLAVPDFALCSTPFGITEFRGKLAELEKQCREECSTPFGITEFRGEISVLTLPDWKCAQRLSASRSFAV